MRMRKMQAISVRQPYAWLIVNGYKDIENRTWPTRFRGTLLIHAAGKLHRDMGWVREIAAEEGIKLPARFSTGGIVGVVEVVSCVQRHRSDWFHGPYGFVLTRPKTLPFYKVSGQQKIFRTLYPSHLLADAGF